MNDVGLKTVTITHLGFGGDGIAQDQDGPAVFVPYGLPGDVARVKMGQGPKAWAKIVDIITSSPDRLNAPPCTHCFDCGGCALQHMRLQAYQDWKHRTVIDRLAKAGMMPDIVHPFISVPTQSRRRATFAAQRIGRRVVVGFNRHHSDQIIDLAECHVVIKDIINIVPGLRVLMDVLLHDTRTADISVTMLDHGLDVLITAPLELNLVMREAMAEFVQTHDIARLSMRAHDRGEAEVILAPKPATVTVGGMSLPFPPGAFLQPSREGERALIECVLAGVGAASRVADLFCGMGTFSYPLAAKGASVQGFDVAITDSVHPQARFQARNLYRDPVTAAELATFEAVVFDPPRAGAKAQGKHITESQVAKIVGVSCNPGTFISDCAPLLEAGYRFTDLWVVDQFTWSAHVEVVGVFTRQ